MTSILSALFLVAGAALCLLAAVGVLRLADFFLRMHAATKAGVAGTGLILIGVGFADPSPAMWTKVAVAVVFLLLTTPIAGHLLARAGYVAGVPLWGGTSDDQLQGALRRGDFERVGAGAVATGHRREAPAGQGRMSGAAIALTGGGHAVQAIRQAIALAKARSIPLAGLAIIDTKLLTNVGPVPLGANVYASQLRHSQMEKARRALADSVQLFEQEAQRAGIAYSLKMDEGDAVAILQAGLDQGALLFIARDGWFDHGVCGGVSDPLRHLARNGIHPVASVASSPPAVRTITFIHDGSSHSDDTLDWLLAADPWPAARLRIVPDTGVAPQDIAHVRPDICRQFDLPNLEEGAVDLAASEVVVFGNRGREGWIGRLRSEGDSSYDGVPIVVFG